MRVGSHDGYVRRIGPVLASLIVLLALVGVLLVPPPRATPPLPPCQAAPIPR